MIWRHNNENHPPQKKAGFEKMKQFKRSLRKHQKYQHSQCRDFRRIRVQKGDFKNVLEEIIPLPLSLSFFHVSKISKWIYVAAFGKFKGNHWFLHVMTLYAACKVNLWRTTTEPGKKLKEMPFWRQWETSKAVSFLRMK